NKTLTSPTINSGTLASGALSGTFTGAPTLSGAVVLSGTPSISSGAALSGTFTGTPTFSGALTLSGGPIISTNPVLFTRTLGTATAARFNVSGDTTDRLQVDASGKHQWSAGGVTSLDTDLFRAGGSTL